MKAQVLSEVVSVKYSSGKKTVPVRQSQGRKRRLRWLHHRARDVGGTLAAGGTLDRPAGGYLRLSRT